LMLVLVFGLRLIFGLVLEGLGMDRGLS
jgi:hypothetical protein